MKKPHSTQSRAKPKQVSNTASPSQQNTVEPIRTTTLFKLGAIAFASIMFLHTSYWVGRYAMIGWDTCSQADMAPVLFECVPGASDPEIWDKCTGREVGVGIADTRKWYKQTQDCKMPGVFGWFSTAEAELDPDEQPDIPVSDEDLVAP